MYFKAHSAIKVRMACRLKSYEPWRETKSRESDLTFGSLLFAETKYWHSTMLKGNDKKGYWFLFLNRKQ